MKIAILNDTHFGCRNDADVFLDYQEKFFKETFFPYLEENNIDYILHLGDLFDRRKYINFKTLHRTEEMFFKPLFSDNYTMDIIVGNHDVFYKDTNKINSLSLLAEKYTNITVHWDKPVMKNYGDIDIALIPWITRDNHDACIEFIKKSDAEICAGHFDIIGFEYMPGTESSEGLKSNVFKRFDQVWSGHYHGKHSKGNIHYLGTQMELTWADANTSKGFHVFDTTTKELEFIANPNKLFLKLYYNEDQINIDNCNLDEYANKYVKVIPVNKTNQITFDHFIDKLNMVHPIDVTIIEENMEQYFDDSIIDMNEKQDTLTILDNYVDQIENVSNNKPRIKKILRELYNEALTAE